MAEKICLALILLGNALNSFAADPVWVKLEIQDDLLTFYYDEKNTTFEGNDIITYLKILYDPPAPDIAYTVDLVRVGCTSQLIETLRTVPYDSSGRPGSNSGVFNGISQPMPGSPGDRLIDAVCAVRPFWRKMLDYFK